MHKYLIYQGMIRLKEKLMQDENDFSEVISIFSLARKQLANQESKYHEECQRLETTLSDLTNLKNKKTSRDFLVHLQDLEKTYDLPRTTFPMKKKRNF